jgi:hypothetical protein
MQQAQQQQQVPGSAHAAAEAKQQLLGAQTVRFFMLVLQVRLRAIETAEL